MTAPAGIATYRRLGWLPPRPRLPLPYRLGTPAAVVRPTSVEEVALVLREATAAGIPLVAYGGGTGVMGGAAPIEGGLVLDLGALNRIIDVSAEDLLACVEPGVVLADLASAAEAKGLLFAHDPWSQPIATVGGAVSTDGVGYLAAGYGTMGEQVRGLEVVLADGQVVSWTGAAKAPGPALWRLFVGAEGTLGVLTRLIVQLFPLPAVRRFAAFRFPTFADGFAAIRQLRDHGLRPSLIDYEEIGPPPLTSPADLYLAFDGPAGVVRAALRLARQVCHTASGTDRGTRAAERFWVHRHDSAYQFLRRVAAGGAPPDRPTIVYANVAVPASRVLDYAAQVVGIGQEHRVGVRSFGIWARPEFVSFNLELNLPAQGATATTGALEEATDAALLLARHLGGSIEYVHGAGVRLAHLLPTELAGAFPLWKRLRLTLDPAGVLNPGKLGTV